MCRSASDSLRRTLGRRLISQPLDSWSGPPPRSASGLLGPRQERRVVAPSQRQLGATSAKGFPPGWPDQAGSVWRGRPSAYAGQPASRPWALSGGPTWRLISPWLRLIMKPRRQLCSTARRLRECLWLFDRRYVRVRLSGLNRRQLRSMVACSRKGPLFPLRRGSLGRPLGGIKEGTWSLGFCLSGGPAIRHLDQARYNSVKACFVIHSHPNVFKPKLPPPRPAHHCAIDDHKTATVWKVHAQREGITGNGAGISIDPQSTPR